MDAIRSQTKGLHMKEFNITNVKVFFKDVEIGEYFKEDHESIHEVFQKVGESVAISQDDGVTCRFSANFPAVLIK